LRGNFSKNIGEGGLINHTVIVRYPLRKQSFGVRISFDNGEILYIEENVKNEKKGKEGVGGGVVGGAGGRAEVAEDSSRALLRSLFRFSEKFIRYLSILELEARADPRGGTVGLEVRFRTRQDPRGILRGVNTRGGIKVEIETLLLSRTLKETTYCECGGVALTFRDTELEVPKDPEMLKRLIVERLPILELLKNTWIVKICPYCGHEEQVM